MKITLIIVFLAFLTEACEKPDIQPDKQAPPHHFDRADTARNNGKDSVELIKPVKP